MPRLSITDHDRDSAGMTYIYPVLSRRSGGLSIGVNLNTNQACNWRCIYCEVPGLIRGSAPDIDLRLLEDELRTLLKDVLEGDFLERYELPPRQRVIRAITLSGNGEPTSCPAFDRVVGTIGQLCAEHHLLGQLKLVLITNGTLMHKAEVQRGVAHWAELGGEVWFKLDSATEAGRQRINSVKLSQRTVRRNLQTCARLCPTWIQTCLFAFDGEPPSAAEQQAYLDFLEGLGKDGITLEGVQLYRLARPSLQPEASRLTALPKEWLSAFGQRIESLGILTRIHP